MKCSSIIDKIAHKKQLRAKARSEPWVTSEIIESIHERDKCLKKINRTKDIEYRTKNFILRNKLQCMVKKQGVIIFLNR